MTTPRTLALVTRLRELHPEFKPDWWLTSELQDCCVACHSDKGRERIDLGWGESRWCCESCGVDMYDDDATYEKVVVFDPPCYIGPHDLLARKYLAELFEVCDAIGNRPCLLDYLGAELPFAFMVTIYHPNATDGYGTTRSEALLAAAEAALGAGEEVQ